jgi:hypothetical protein
MCPESAPQQDQSSVLSRDFTHEMAPEITPSTPWRVKHVQPLTDYRLKVTFADGVSGEVQLKNLIHSPNAGVFAPLADPARFAQVSIEYGAVVWPGDLDLAPDAMYQAIKQTGKWTL